MKILTEDTKLARRFSHDRVVGELALMLPRTSSGLRTGVGGTETKAEEDNDGPFGFNKKDERN